MTTNIDRAAQIITECVVMMGERLALDIARRLADEGLITPDPVKPSRTESDGYAVWNLEHIDISAETEIGKVYVDGNDITPKEAREEAAALLAAAGHAEGVGRA